MSGDGRVSRDGRVSGDGEVSGDRQARDARKDRWSAHRDERRRRFVDAALRLLEAEGPELPMDAVAVEAGVSKPVLYRYFSDKAELIDALAERGSEYFLARMLPTINAGGPVLDRIAGAVGAYFAVIDEHPNLYWLIARRDAAPGGRYPGVQPDKESIAMALTAVIGDYMWFFGLDSGAAEPWAFGVTGLVQTTGEWWLQRRSMSRAHVVEYVTQLIWAALTGILGEAGIRIEPDQPMPVIRPRLSVRRAERQ
ncbi:MAG TPA: TetR/AcrR family transcriptional regulator [Streptosporangiaceae bacterium]|nr:TetR/AcrR family transcriptional regulator [Streptosporangiaceae bacterium]